MPCPPTILLRTRCSSPVKARAHPHLPALKCWGVAYFSSITV